MKQNRILVLVVLVATALLIFLAYSFVSTAPSVQDGGGGSSVADMPGS
jgi:hypothetical protein